MKPQLLLALAVRFPDHPPTSSLQEVDLAAIDVESADVPTLHALARRTAIRLQPFSAIEQWDALTAIDQTNLLTEFGWLLRAFSEWNGTDDPRGRRLFALFAIASAWDGQGGYWPSVSSVSTPDATWIRAAEKIVQGASASLSGSADAPIWEQDEAKSLQEADRGEDWVRLAKTLNRFSNVVGDTVLTQATRALGACSPLRLSTLLVERKSWLDSIQILHCLGPDERYRIALASGTARAHFASIALCYQQPALALDSLTQLIVSVAGDAKQWAALLDLCLGAITQYLPIQAVLGRVLTMASDDAIKAFVDAVELSPLNNDHHPISDLLLNFVSQAPEAARRTLLHRAYERWHAWSFGLPEAQEMTRGPSGSTLDVAVSRWLAMYADETTLIDGMAEAQKAIVSIEQRWHDSKTTLKRQMNAFRSRSSMFTTAHAMTSSGLTQTYTPPTNEQTLSAYQIARYMW